MEYADIKDKELKLTFHLLSISKKSKKDFSELEETVYSKLKKVLPIESDERETIYIYAKSCGWIDAPEYLQKGKRMLGMPIYNLEMFPHVTLTQSGEHELSSLLVYANQQMKERELSNSINRLQEQLLEKQIEITDFTKVTTERTIKIANSAKWAAWASAICAIIMLICTVMSIIIN